MLSLQDFPTELIDNIVRQLSRSDITQCLIVNKLFYKSAIKEFYKSLVLDVEHTGAFSEYLRIEGIERDKNFDEHKHLITQLKFRDFWNVFVLLGFKRYSVLSFKLFTSLSFIDISSCFVLNDILQYLADCDKAILPNLQQMVVFNDVVSLYNKSKYSTRNLYLYVCYKHRHTLTHLEMFDPYSSYSLVYHDYGEKHLDLLPSFVKLQNLTIHYRYDDEQIYRLLRDSVLFACPDLTHFKTICDYHIQHTSDLKESSPKIRNIKCPTSFPRISKLKYVSLDIRTIDTVCMQNILSNIATSQLNRFTLDLTCGYRMNRWIKSIDINTLRSFLQHLKLAKESIIYAQYIDGLLTPESLKEGLHAMHKVWIVSNTLKPEEQEKPSKIYLQVEFDFEKTELDLSYSLDLKSRTLHGYQKISEKFFFSKAHSYLLQMPFYDAAIDPTFRENIEELRLKVFTFEAHERTYFLLNQFPQLKKLQIGLMDEPEDWKFVMCRKPMMKLPDHLQVQDSHPINNYYSPVDIETHYTFVREECYIYGSRSNVIIDSYKITGIPITSRGFDRLRLTLNNRLKHLTLDFQFLVPVKRTMLILVQFFNTNTEIAYNFMVFADLESRSVTHVPGLYKLEHCSPSLQGGTIEIFSEGFDEISIANSGTIAFHKIFSEAEKVKGPQTWGFEMV